MNEQLPTPISELIYFNLYLGSITYLIAIGFIIWVMLRNSRFNWFKFVLILILLFGLGSASSILVWSLWTGSFDIMFGPLHLPTLIVVLVLAPVLLRLFGYKNLKKKPVPNNK